MLANTMELEQEDVLKAVNMYTQALTLLDQYDHQVIVKPQHFMNRLDIGQRRRCDYDSSRICR